MKKLLLIPGMAVLSLYADLSVNQVENMVEKIHEKRPGVDLSALNQTKEPFVMKQEEEKETVYIPPAVVKTETRMSLHAIVNGKAYINDAWKSVDENIFGYTLKYIGKRGVVLTNGNQIKKLFLHEKKGNFIKIAEGE